MDELEKTKSINDLNIEGLNLQHLEALREEIINEYGDEKTNQNDASNGNNAKGKSYVKASPTQRVDHSSYPGMSNSGFATNIILGLIIAFASGALVSTIYIFMNLGNSVFTL